MKIKEWIKKANKWVASNNLLDGNDIGWHRENGGVVPYLIKDNDTVSDSTSSPCVLPAKVVSKAGAFYRVDIYANGYDEGVTQTNVLAKVLMLNYADTLPAGTEILVAANYIDATGGGTP